LFALLVGAFSLESALYWAVTSYGKQDNPAFEEVLKPGYKGFPLIKADDRAVEDIPFFNDWASHPEKDDYWKTIDGQNRTNTTKRRLHILYYQLSLILRN
jgi:hypothetical protein